MKIILTSIGTRGDMEPFLAIGEILKEKGHSIICLFPEQFRSLAEDSGFEFRSLGSEFIEMLDSPAGRTAMGGGKFGLKKLRAYLKLVSMQKEIHKQMIMIQEEVFEEEKPDRVVHNGKVMYPVIWGMKNKGRVLVSAVPYLHYVKDHSHVAFNRDFGPWINKQTYNLANFGLIKTISGSIKYLKQKEKISAKDIKRELLHNKCMYTISPSLFKRPEYWDDNFQVLGYHERKKTVNWEPTSELIGFLNSHDKVVMVTFGSMINKNPAEKTKIILDILERNQIPAIINTASGGLIKPEVYDRKLFHFVERIPYDWLLPRIYAMIHHGGSGTTHTAIKYGCASMIIPHIIDQYVWNKIVAQKGVGPLGIDVNDISRKKLEPKVLNLLNNREYKKKAEEVGREIQNEEFKEELCSMIIDE